MRECPSREDWGFEEIAEHSPKRAAYLERGGSPDELVTVMVQEMVHAAAGGRVRFGVDSLRNEGSRCRAIIQFQVSAMLYDWFFNARGGYRAQFWMSAAAGLAFNRRLVTVLAMNLEPLLAVRVPGRIIEVFENTGRDERDTGSIPLERDFLVNSLRSPEGKAWICERLIQPNGGAPAYQGALIAAPRMPKLRVPRWMAATPRGGERGEGTRAPYPNGGEAWIDIKGGFIGGRSEQGKDSAQRAKDLHETGWT